MNRRELVDFLSETLGCEHEEIRDYIAQAELRALVQRKFQMEAEAGAELEVANNPPIRLNLMEASVCPLVHAGGAPYVSAPGGRFFAIRRCCIVYPEIDDDDDLTDTESSSS